MKFKNLALPLFIALLLAVFFFNKNDVTLSAQDNFILQPISSSGFILQSDVHLNNPNLLSCTIKSIHEEFRVNGTVIGILNQEINQGIPGRKESVFPVSIRFGKDALSGIPVKASTVDVGISGEIVFTNLVSGGKITVHQNAQVGMPADPD